MRPLLFYKKVIIGFLFALFSSVLLMPYAKAETCGVCRDSYLSCVSGGGDLNSCASRMRSCESACYGYGGSGTNSNDSGFDISAVLIPVVILGLVGYFIVWPLVSGFMEGSHKSGKNQNLEVVKNNNIDVAIEDKVKITKKLREEIDDKIKDMTVAEISEYTKSTARSTVAWLTRHGRVCKDFDGARKKEEQIKKV